MLVNYIVEPLIWLAVFGIIALAVLYAVKIIKGSSKEEQVMEIIETVYEKSDLFATGLGEKISEFDESINEMEKKKLKKKEEKKEKKRKRFNNMLKK